jgi:hypothetical protein
MYWWNRFIEFDRLLFQEPQIRLEFVAASVPVDPFPANCYQREQFIGGFEQGRASSPAIGPAYGPA